MRPAPAPLRHVRSIIGGQLIERMAQRQRQPRRAAGGSGLRWIAAPFRVLGQDRLDDRRGGGPIIPEAAAPPLGEEHPVENAPPRREDERRGLVGPPPSVPLLHARARPP